MAGNDNRRTCSSCKRFGIVWNVDGMSKIRMICSKTGARAHMAGFCSEHEQRK